MSRKFDGHRALLFTPPKPGGPVLLQTRRGSLIHDRFPDLVTAALEQLPPGLVLDGKLVVWDPEADALSFEALQRRAAARARSAPALAASTPRLLHRPRHPPDGRDRTAETAVPGAPPAAGGAVRGPRPDLAVDPVPDDHRPRDAREWLETWTDVTGVEGILIKMNQHYLQNHRGWTKIRRRDATGPSSALSPEPSRARGCSSSVATITRAASARSTAQHLCVRSSPATSPRR